MTKHYSPARRESYRASETSRRERDDSRRRERAAKALTTGKATRKENR